MNDIPIYVLMCAGSSRRFNEGLNDEQRDKFSQAIVERDGEKEVLKNLLPIGPNGETLLEYNLKKFKDAGGKEVVLVVRHDTEANYRSLFGDSFQGLTINYAHQKQPDYRSKPKGTIDALVAAHEFVRGKPFIGSNADDIYGPAFQTLFENAPRHDCDITTPGYTLSQVIPRTGETYTMAVLKTKDQELTDCTEYHEIKWDQDKLSDIATNTPLDLESGASMNIVYVAPGAYEHMIAANMTQPYKNSDELKAKWGKDEFLIPNFLSMVPSMEKTSCRVISFDHPRPPGVTWASDIDKIKETVLQEYHGGDKGKLLWSE